MAIINGTPWEDLLTGTTGNDTFIGGLGDDTLQGGAGPGADTFLFGPDDGQDVIFADGALGEASRHLLKLGSGLDSDTVDLYRDDADLVLYRRGSEYGVGDDTSDGVRIVDYFVPSLLNRMKIQFADASVWDGAAIDRDAQPFGATFSGTPMDDVIDGGPGHDTLHGGEGDDALWGHDGNDILHGEAGNDIFFGNAGSDTFVIDRGDGYDIVAVEGIGLDRVQLGTGINLADFDLLRSEKPFDGDLILSWLDNSQTILMEQYFIAWPRSTAPTLHFADGSVLDSATIERLLQPVDDQIFATSPSGSLLLGGRGNDSLVGGSGNDTLYGDTDNDTLEGGLGADTFLFGRGDGQDVVLDARSQDRLKLGEGIGLVDIETGIDEGSLVISLAGTGDSVRIADYFNVAPADRLLIELADGSLLDARKLLPSDDQLFGTPGDDTLDGGLGNDSLFGMEGNDTLIGDGGNDLLDGGAGADLLVGGQGNDVYLVDDQDVIVEQADAGIDTVASTGSWTLASNLEQLQLLGADATHGTGNELNNSLRGNIGDNQLDGGEGADTLIGGKGNDVYRVDDVGDTVIELAGEGTDTVFASVSWTLPSHLENLTLNGLADTAIGNDKANVLTSIGGNTLIGGKGNDTYVIDSIFDSVRELSNQGTDTVVSSVIYTLDTSQENLTLTGSDDIYGKGNNQDNILIGNVGNNVLMGGAGADTMIGGAGDDSYSVSSSGDVVVEIAGQGVDSVDSTVSFTLGEAVENLDLTGSGNINGTGNALDNVIEGNSGANVLSGGAGADSMTGGSGSDTYVVDDIGDLVVEVASGGNDTVRASINYTLGTSQENLTLTGTSNIRGTGNDQENTLIGNDGDNILDGGADNDIMQGGLGNDLYYVDHASDVVVESGGEGSGYDIVYTTLSFTLGANVEAVHAFGSFNRTLIGNDVDNSIIGNTGNNMLVGAAGSDYLNGSAGRDTLHGGTGDDRLWGGTGSDTYLYNSGDGFDHIQEMDHTPAPIDRVVFGDGILQGDVQFLRVGEDLNVRLVSDFSQGVSIDRFFEHFRYRVEEFEFADGNVITGAQAEALVGAMAVFSAPAAGSTSPADMSSRMTTQDLAVNLLG